MLNKSSTKPQARLLNLFEIVDDWLEAPKLNTKLSVGASANHQKLIEYLTLEAAKASAVMPEMLANQLYFMVISAAQEKMSDSHSKSFKHAKNAAQALIDAQTKHTFHFSKKAVYASMGGLLLASIVSVSFIFNNDAIQTPSALLANVNPMRNSNALISQTNNIAQEDEASPLQTAALFAKIEQMRKGNCQLIEALQLPDAYKRVYFENIVRGQISTNKEDQRITNELLQMVRCNYTPMLMSNSK